MGKKKKDTLQIGEQEFANILTSYQKLWRPGDSGTTSNKY